MQSCLSVAKVLITVMAASIFATTAAADQFLLPFWRVGSNPPFVPLSTVQEWEFNTAPGVVPLTADGGSPFYNPNGIVSAAPVNLGVAPVLGTANAGWQALTGGGRIDFDIPNAQDHEPHKFMWVQVTIGNRDAAPSIGSITTCIPGDLFCPVGGYGITSPTRTSQVHPADSAFNDDIFDFYLYQWEFSPNPSRESFSLEIPQFASIYQVSIDTFSTTPEPGSLVLFLLGVLILLGHSRVGKMSAVNKHQGVRSCNPAIIRRTLLAW